ncbi:histidinol dehydrogenase [Pleionea sp. CnH1-48]|uniref:histidinol dehydrogenase n=1 Tax=Pleionea sp. CnH1-48 TaxID=2954494 RepID=UPI00209865EC|nr:histidinol dehydrogenase [Pleionea sp. CnH1-48]MCO7223095.1 histidinol dehydrogenase [Pleionea sp. CnH1-48]
MIVNTTEWRRPKTISSTTITAKVTQLLSQIKKSGDKSIRQLSQNFDQFVPEKIELKPFSEYELGDQLKQSIQQAAQRIERFAQVQRESLTVQSFKDDFGEYQQVINPIKSVGAYIPGGRFPLISSALMTLIPAKVAGCSRRVACSPSRHPAILAAASLAGATDFYHLGGVQAIAAMAYGFESLQPVDLIVGPGNAWVNEAKSQLQSQVKIDGVAGPSELMALCDGSQPIDWLAHDALAQSEHDPMAQSIIVSDDDRWLEQMATQLNDNADYSSLIEQQQIQLVKADSLGAMIEFSQNYAPEHLMLCHGTIAPEQLTNYGSLFIGANSAVALGDYCSGPNHTLPTMGLAKQTGGLSVHTFLKIQTIQKISDYGRVALSQIAMPLADAEGLKFHYESLKIRI